VFLLDAFKDLTEHLHVTISCSLAITAVVWELATTSIGIGSMKGKERNRSNRVLPDSITVALPDLRILKGIAFLQHHALDLIRILVQAGAKELLELTASSSSSTTVALSPDACPSVKLCLTPCHDGIGKG
jgi:hypothetical protein